MDPRQRHQSREQLRKAFDRKECLAPAEMHGACTHVVSAHSIQCRGYGLQSIEEDGHVLTSQFVDDEFSVRRIGIKKASTFSGFCGYHDTTLFSPVETKPYIGSSEQRFLLLYRALAKEVFLKRGSSVHAQVLLDEPSASQLVAEPWEAGVTIGLRELEGYKALADKLLVQREFDKVGHYVVQFTSAPFLVCATWTAVEFGFQGQVIQNLDDVSVPASGVAFTMLSTVDGGIAIFSWLDTPPALNRLIRSLDKISDDRLPDLLLFFALEYSENCHWNQTWWARLDPSTRTSLEHRFRSGTAAAPRKRDSLVDRGLKAAGWRICGRTLIRPRG